MRELAVAAVDVAPALEQLSLMYSSRIFWRTVAVFKPVSSIFPVSTDLSTMRFPIMRTKSSLYLMSCSWKLMNTLCLGVVLAIAFAPTTIPSPTTQGRLQ